MMTCIEIMQMYVYTVELDPSAAKIRRMTEKKPKLNLKTSSISGRIRLRPLHDWLQAFNNASTGTSLTLLVMLLTLPQVLRL